MQTCLSNSQECKKKQAVQQSVAAVIEKMTMHRGEYVRNIFIKVILQEKLCSALCRKIYCSFVPPKYFGGNKYRTFYWEIISKQCIRLLIYLEYKKIYIFTV